MIDLDKLAQRDGSNELSNIKILQASCNFWQAIASFMYASASLNQCSTLFWIMHRQYQSSATQTSFQRLNPYGHYVKCIILQQNAIV